MKKILLIFTFVVCYRSKDVTALRLPGPQVYVVTPSARPLQIDEGKSAPFYYQNWMRRMDTPQSSTTTTAAPKVKTPDLIFAEFDSDGKMQKSIRNLLEKEKIKSKSTTAQPIYVPGEETTKVTRIVNYGLPAKMEASEEDDSYIIPENKPVYLPSTTTTTTKPKPTTTHPVNIENIWHIIDNEKLNQQPGNWDEIPIDSSDEKEVQVTNNNEHEIKLENSAYGQDDDSESNNNEEEDVKIDENFAFPGFGTNSGSGAENESRAIRTEPNIRFPYVNLKPFQMKSPKKPLLNSKKTNTFSLDNFYDLKEPVRGEAQDISSVSQQIDRYNPAQPYLPKQEYGGGISNQNSPASNPVKATANLVPPPPPPPRITGNDFPSPSSYESFPPYPPSSASFPSAPAPAPASIPKPQSPSTNPLIAPSIEVPVDTDSDDGDDNTVMDLGYRYKAPPPPQFLPTAPPAVKFDGYSYNKPSILADMTPPVADKPDFQGYQYNKPAPAPPSDDKPNDFEGYHYSKPTSYDSPPSYGSDDSPPPTDDHGFPSDFPGDLKFHHDFDDHDHDLHYHHHPTTTTTETPRVNRYSYYYLGKKLYYLPLYFSVYFIVYVGALIIKAILRHKIVYPNSWRPNDTTASFFSKRSVDAYLSNNDKLHELTGRVTHAIATAAEKYMRKTSKSK